MYIIKLLIILQIKNINPDPAELFEKADQLYSTPLVVRPNSRTRTLHSNFYSVTTALIAEFQDTGRRDYPGDKSFGK